MGLTNWEKSPDGKILKSDITIAKNYLDEKELKNLNNLVNLFLDIAENNAEKIKYLDWLSELDYGNKPINNLQELLQLAVLKTNETRLNKLLIK